MQQANFRGNLPAGSGEKNFKGFLQYTAMAAIMVIRPASYYQILISMYLKAYIQNLAKNDPAVSVKSMF